MAIFPDWNSAESTARVSDLLFWISILALAALLVAEVGSHVYSKRSSILERGPLLSDAQISNLTSLFASLEKPTQPVELDALSSDSQAIILANQLKKAFLAAGFQVNGVVETMLVSSQGEGIQVRQKRADGPLGVGVLRALQDVGLECELVVSDMPGTDLYIWVSHRKLRIP